MKLLKSLAVLSLVLYPAAVSSAEDIALSGNNMGIWTSGNGEDIIRVTTPDKIVNNWGCTDPDSYIVRSTSVTQVKERIYATLLSAKAHGMSLTIRVQGCESDRPAILDVLWR